MQLKSNGSIYLGVTLLCVIMSTGIVSAEELSVNFVSQIDINNYNDAGITNTFAIQGQDLISHFGGSISNVAVAGNYAYLGQGQDMLVIDISDVSGPSEVGRVTTPSLVNNIATSGKYAYIANSENGLVIVDISDPALPVIVGNCDSSFAYGVAVEGHFAYIADGASGLLIVNISDPTAPMLEGVYNTAGLAFSVAIAGGYAYVADGVNGLVVIDIDDPSSPSIKGAYNTAGIAYDVAVAGDHTYVADGANGLVILNITDPSSPFLSDTYDTEVLARGVNVSGSYAYVADGDGGGLVIVDISDPANVFSSAVYRATTGNAYDVAVSGDCAYIAFGRSGLAIVNITNPAAPTFAGKYDMSGYASGVVIADNYAYVANGYMGLSIINIADRSSPTSAGRYITAGYARDVAVKGSYAYVANDINGLVIVDISDPFAPAYKGRYDTAGCAWDVDVNGSYAYIADGENGLVIVDISNPSAPAYKSSCDTPGKAENVVVSGSYAYVADGESGLVVINISDPAIPLIENSYNTAGHSYGISVVHNYAYIADGTNGLVILDVSNPASLTFKGSYGTYFAQDIAVSGNHAYIADDRNGLMVLNVTNPSAPTLAGSYNTAGYGYGVAVSGNYVYVADFNNGLVILQVDHGSNVPDTTAPAPVMALDEVEAGPTWIKWVWTNPNDIDFSHVMLFFDGTFITNISEGYYNSTGLIEGSTHTLSIKTVDTSGNINPTWVNVSATTTLSADSIPPGSITDLGENGTGSDWIRWAWINPTDADFSHVMVYIDGVFVTNTVDSSVNSYNATGLSEGVVHIIGIRTVDYSGNVNSIWVNGSATTVKFPKISNLSGTNITKTSITLAWESSDDTSWVQIKRNGVAFGNVTGSTRYVDNNLSSGSVYAYTLIPYDQYGLEGRAVSVDLRTKSGSSEGGSSRSSSKKSSSGGTGNAASVEDFENLAIRDVATAFLRMDSNATYVFSKEGNPILSISLCSLKNSGQITSTIEVLNNISKLVNSTPDGTIYKYVNIWVGKAGFATASNIEDAHVTFKVNSSWIQQMGVSPGYIRLQRYNGTAWEVLPTRIANNSTEYVLFESQVPGFSSFAITAEKALAAASIIRDTDTGIISEGSLSDHVRTDGTNQDQKHQKSKTWLSIATILVIGTVTAGYVYLKRKQN
ncbi:PGF-pre-PGF domain-containing protein [Methanomethylovorans sp.]|uniref:PGF-pre-PGF domain-containing protein n=1 Tax=Methanomethylovorans sp. TaxID=2758717 RepID=UPI00345F01EF